MVLVLPSGTIIDTAEPDADQKLRSLEPEIHEGLLRLRKRVLENPESMAKIRQQYSMKNTMGYGLNSLVDFETPVDILQHLLIGSEGTLGFVASATYRTLPILKNISTGLLVFDNLIDAARSVPELVANKLATVELMDATSIRVAQRTGQAAEGARRHPHLALRARRGRGRPRDGRKRTFTFLRSIQLFAKHLITQFPKQI